MIKMLSMFIINISLLMLFLNNPLSMGLMILIQTSLICIMSGMMIKTYWFSYILFLVFLGGLLVLFIYVSSIASNELFLTSNMLKMFLMFIIIISIFSFINSFNNNLFMNFSINSDMINFFNYNNLLLNSNFNKINLNKLYNSQTFLLMMMMMIYLFITLIAVVKITNIFYGPLRSKFN
uniref:NADH-ubiquinone oxidoreductase chain 6 n=7 Tax=Lymantria TaxID=13122 RepID=A0A343IU95_LYMDI|nr:NADH dehydrogenase subunit 6 [Lymantria dispar dispar]AST23740.2 NADH dehydrogenase subunit 6 [Lymantria dispar]AST23766.2 NADH dehydrogenase subunit 6 [Lymantria dispar]AST23779.2 NADH dehydrogenase subunit 6 [Lymantria dispar]AST23818.2 NADH dehydrogenase subunit 6 [Lymantria sp. AN-2017]